MKYPLIALILTLFVSCSDKTITSDYTVQNDQDIKDYIITNKLIATKTASGMYYVMTKEGTGVQPTANSNVTVAYKGTFINGKIFDQSTDAGITFNLQQVILGWREGISYFKEGGKGILLIPSHLGYGNKDYSTIPGGSVLIFEINLISVK